jgi:hypothetical protein
MRKFLMILLIGNLSITTFAQLKFQGSLIPGPTPTSADVVLRPNTSFNGYFTNVVFNFQVPTSVTQPVITLTSLSTFFPSFAALPPVTDGGYVTYGYAATYIAPPGGGGPTVSIGSGANYPLVRLNFSGGPSTPTDVRLAHLADGGTTGLNQFYVAANNGFADDYTNYAQMFFGTTISPTSPIDPNVGYSTYQFTQISQVLPVTWLDFTAVKKNNDALLSWKVADEQNNDHYELERSLNGTTFTTIAKVANLPGSGTKDYTNLDQNIINLRSNVIYYRVKQVDIDGKFTYSPIRSLRLDIKGEIAIHPNPVKKGFYLTVPFINSALDKKISLNLVNGAGQIVDRREITASQAANYYFDIQKPGIIAGSYMLRIYTQSELLDTKKIIVNR